MFEQIINFGTIYRVTVRKYFWPPGVLKCYA